MSRQTQFRLLVMITLAWVVWAGWSMANRATPYELQILDDLGAPVELAVADAGGRQLGTSGPDGVIPMEWDGSTTVIEVTAPGHVPRRVTVSERPEEPVEIVLTARFLRGVVTDGEGQPLSGAVVKSGSGTGETDSDGRFSIRGAEPGQVTVERPAWHPTTFEWDGGQGDQSVQLEPMVLRAVHVSGEAVRDRYDEFLQLATSTELNAVMIDIKDETGLVWYDTEDPTANEVGANYQAFDLSEVVRRAKEQDLYVIARLVVFNDPIAAIREPEMAVWDSELQKPYSANGQYFLDPTDPDARAYGLALAVEACGLGVDEIQFDYVRFPDQRRESAIFDEGVSADVRLATINGFLTEAVSKLHPMGCAVGADVFGFITKAVDDGAIGQKWEDIANIVDVVSPMVYPSHYSTGWYGFDNPNDHPGPMVENALRDGMARLPRRVVVRPWLQDFGYDASQVREQIDVVEQFGLGWMLWNARSNVTVEALQPSS
ncbi:MAG TPA: putative glycoside hydrolase [Acidimicrobiia bacterium]